MDQEEVIKQQFIDKFGIALDKINIKRSRRMSLEVDSNILNDILEYAIKQAEFVMLSAITGIDEGQTLGIIYHLGREDGIVLNLKTSVPKDNPLLNTVINYFPCAEVYERELVDLLGINVQGLPKGNRYPLTDDWPVGQYPLRKDWKAT